MRSLWVQKVGSFVPDGEIVSVVITTDEGPLLLRAKRSTAFQAAGVLQRGLAKEPRIAEVVPLRKRPSG